MNAVEQMILDQEIICKSLKIVEAMELEPSDFFTKEMLDRLPQLSKIETEKLVLLEEKGK